MPDCQHGSHSSEGLTVTLRCGVLSARPASCDVHTHGTSHVNIIPCACIHIIGTLALTKAVFTASMPSYSKHVTSMSARMFSGCTASHAYTPNHHSDVRARCHGVHNVQSTCGVIECLIFFSSTSRSSTLISRPSNTVSASLHTQHIMEHTVLTLFGAHA